MTVPALKKILDNDFVPQPTPANPAISEHDRDTQHRADDHERLGL